MKAIIYRNLPEDGSASLNRYANELSSALLKIANADFLLEDVTCYAPNFFRKVAASTLNTRLDRALCRYLTYPYKASRTSGSIFHILDHSNAQVSIGLDPKRTVITSTDIIPILISKKNIPIEIPTLTIKGYKFRLKFLSRAAKVISISAATKLDLVRILGFSPESIEVIHLGVSNIFSPITNIVSKEELRQKLRIPDDAKIIFHLGTAGRHKNTQAIIKALSIINSTMNLNVWLIRVGAEFESEETQLIKELGLKKKIIHAGRGYSDKELADFYRLADIFVFPSLWEGFGWPPLEAMACGIPIVTSNVASLPEIVGDAGILVEPMDIEGLTKAIYRVLVDENLHKNMSKKGLERAGLFTWDITAKKTLQVYQDVWEAAERSRK